MGPLKVCQPLNQNIIPYGHSFFTKNAINLANKLYGTQKFNSREPITYHLKQTADMLHKWKMDDITISAGILHRFKPEELFKHFSTQEQMEQPIRIVSAFRTMRDVQPIETQNKLTNQKLVESNYCKMLLKTIYDQKKYTPEEIFKALMVMAADQLSTLKSAGFGYWDIPINIDSYSSIAISTAKTLFDLGLETIAGEIFDAAMQAKNPREKKEFEQTFYKFFGSKTPTYENLLKIRRELASGLAQATQQTNTNFSLYGRIKSLTSAKQKVDKKGMERLSDMLGFRIIIDTNQTIDSIAKFNELLEQRKKNSISEEEIEKGFKSYTEAKKVLYTYNNFLSGLTEKNNWQEISENYDDYVEKPKENGYQAIQRTFCFLSGNSIKQFEVQLQTRGMFEWATWGGASHLKYKGKDITTGENLGLNEKFSKYLETISKNSYGFKNSKNIEGPYEIKPIEGKMQKVIDLAYVIDPKWAEFGAQFFITSKYGEREKECTAGTNLKNGELLRVSTSPNVVVTEERINLCGSLSSRKFLREKYIEKKKLNPKKVRDEGKNLFNAKLEEAKKKACKNFGINEKETNIFINTPQLLKDLNLVDNDELYEETFFENNKIDTMIEKNFIILNTSNNKTKIIAKNKKFIESILIKLNKVKKFTEFRLKSDDDCCTLEICAGNMKQIEKAIEDTLKEKNPHEIGCKVSGKENRYSLSTNKTIDETINLLIKEFIFIHQKYIKQLDVSLTKDGKTKVEFSFASSSVKSEYLTSCLSKLLRSKEPKN